MKLCIFDLDGTVLDTVSSIAHCGNRALEKYGIAPIEVERYRYFAGDGAANLVRRMLVHRNRYTDDFYSAFFRDFSEIYAAEANCGITVFKGLREVLDALKAAGYHLVIVTNKPDYAAEQVVEAHYKKGYFDCIIGQKTGSYLKPHPGEVLNVMQKMNVAPKDCVYVGDTDTDMKTGKNAGLYTIGVLWGFRDRNELEANGADVIVATPEELYHTIVNYMG